MENESKTQWASSGHMGVYILQAFALRNGGTYIPLAPDLLIQLLGQCTQWKKSFQAGTVHDIC